MTERDPQLHEIEKLIRSGRISKEQGRARIESLKNILTCLSEPNLKQDNEHAQLLKVYLQKEESLTQAELVTARLSEKWAQTQAVAALQQSEIDEMRRVHDMYAACFPEKEAQAMLSMNASNAEVEKKISIMNGHNAEMAKLEQQLQEEDDYVEVQNRETDDSVKNIEVEVEECKKRILILSEDVLKGQDELKIVKNEFEEKQKQKNDIEKENQELNTELENKHKENEGKQKELSLRESLLKEKQCKTDDELKEMIQKIEKQKTCNAEQVKEIESLYVHQEDIEKGLQILNNVTDISDAVRRLDHIKKGITQKHTTLLDKQVELKTAQQKIEERSHNLQDIRSKTETTTICPQKIEETNKRLDEILEKIALKQSENDRLVTTFTAKETSLNAELESKTKQNADMLKSQEEARHSHDAELEELRKNVDSLDKEYQLKKAAYKSVHTECVVLKKSFKDRLTQIGKKPPPRSERSVELNTSLLSSVVQSPKVMPMMPEDSRGLKRSQDERNDSVTTVMNCSQETAMSSEPSYDGVKVARFDKSLFKMPRTSKKK